MYVYKSFLVDNFWQILIIHLFNNLPILTYRQLLEYFAIFMPVVSALVLLAYVLIFKPIADLYVRSPAIKKPMSSSDDMG